MYYSLFVWGITFKIIHIFMITDVASIWLKFIFDKIHELFLRFYFQKKTIH